MAENIKTFKIAAKEGVYQERLNELDQAISNVKKNITYLDTLNIIDAVIDKKNFAAQINALTPNSSLVINTEPFNEGGVNYSRGDIILKDASDIIHHIPGQSGGLYYPKKITQPDAEAMNYNIEYTFINAIPPTGVVSVAVGEEIKIEDAKQNIEFSGIGGGKAEDSFIYGYCGALGNSHIIPNITQIPNVDPIIEFYFMDNSGSPKERVEIEYGYAWGNNELSISFTHSTVMNILSSLYVKVK